MVKKMKNNDTRTMMPTHFCINVGCLLQNLEPVQCYVFYENITNMIFHNMN